MRRLKMAERSIRSRYVREVHLLTPPASAFSDPDRMVFAVRALVLNLICLTALLVPATAVAQKTTAPPGNSGIGEYVETVPEATGGKAPEKAGGGSVPAAERQKLEALGADGKALADTIAATVPRRPRSNGSGGQAEPIRRADADAGDSAASAVLHSVVGGGSSGGMGLLLPIILGATLALMLAAAFARRRTAR
jgi:hypothetical protein